MASHEAFSPLEPLVNFKVCYQNVPRKYDCFELHDKTLLEIQWLAHRLYEAGCLSRGAHIRTHIRRRLRDLCVFGCGPGKAQPFLLTREYVSFANEYDQRVGMSQ